MAQALQDSNLPFVACVGCGYWGKNLVRSFAAINALAAVSDADPQLAAEMGKTYGVPALSFDAILASPQIRAVALATPAALHARHVAQALRAEKEVFVEKPLALTSADGRALVRLAASHGRRLMVGHLLQYHPAFLELLSMVRSGTLGEVHHIYSNRLNLGKIRREENVLWSFAPHDVSMILTLMGASPVSVTAMGAGFLDKNIADTTSTYLAFDGARIAHIFVSWLHPFKEQKLVVVGSAGHAVFDDIRPWSEKLMFYRHSVRWEKGQPLPNRAEGEPVPLDADEPLKRECMHFVDVVRNGGTPRTDGDEALRVLEVLEAAERSMQEHRSVPLAEIRGEDRPKTRPLDISAASNELAAGVFVHESAYIDNPVKIGRGTRIWHFSHILGRTEIGERVTIGQNVVIGPDVKVGNNCKIQNNVSIYKGVELGEGVFCGPSCVFTNVLTPRAEIERKDEFRPTKVGRGATIGANATIVCGHSIGEYAMVAAGAVVTKDVPPYALVAGVPARRIGWVSESGERLGPDLVCARTGRRYREGAADTLLPLGA